MTVLDAQLAALRIIKNGVSGGEADFAAREVIRRAGYGEDFGHSLGHGVGLELDEFPVIFNKWAFPAVPGQVIAIEPKVMLPGIGAVGIENTYHVQAGLSGLKLECLTTAPDFIEP